MAVTKDQVAEVAEQVCNAFASGRRGIMTIGRVAFNLSDVAYCARFVRECHEAALGLNEYSWAFGAANARQMETALKAGARRTTNPQRGDIVCFNNGGGTFGHVGIYLGKFTRNSASIGLFAENTSSRSRGPGFVVSLLSDMAGRISGYYSVLPAADDKPVPQVFLVADATPSGKRTILIECYPCEEVDGTTRCDMKPLVQARGGAVHWNNATKEARVFFNGEEISLDGCDVKLEGNVLRCNLRDTAEHMGLKVDYDPKTGRTMLSNLKP